MTAQGLKELAQTKSPKFGHFIVEFATPGIGTFSSRPVATSCFSISSIPDLVSRR
jgi:hypothetical protein